MASLPFRLDVTDFTLPMAHNKAAQSFSIKSISRNIATPHSRTPGRARRTTAFSVRKAKVRMSVNFSLRQKRVAHERVSKLTTAARVHTGELPEKGLDFVGRDNQI
jgi:hypothetical protein